MYCTADSADDIHCQRRTPTQKLQKEDDQDNDKDINNTETDRDGTTIKKKFGRSGVSKFGSIQTTVFCPNFAPPLAEMLFINKFIFK